MNSPYLKTDKDWEAFHTEGGRSASVIAADALRLLVKGKSIRINQRGVFERNPRGKLQVLGFLSGGTGGTQEEIVHTISSLKSAVQGLKGRLGPQPMDCVCCLPLWHLGGWMQLERAWGSGGRVSFCNYKELINPGSADWLGGKWISLVPTQLHQMMKSPTAVSALKKARGIFLGGAAINSQLASRARESELPLYPCYGLSETAGMVAMLDAQNFLEGVDGVGYGLPHAEIRIDKASRRVSVKTTSLCLARADHQFGRGDWLPTPDLAEIGPTGSLMISGRADRIINTGGVKVNPTLIEAQVLATGLVEECIVFGEADPRWGERVVAWATPESIDLEKLKQRLMKSLSEAERPKEWRLNKHLPLGQMGKPLKSISGRV